MGTRVLKRKSADCYDCGHSHQFRLLDRDGTEVVVAANSELVIPGLTPAELFHHVVRLVQDSTNEQRRCPLS